MSDLIDAEYERWLRSGLYSKVEHRPYCSLRLSPAAPGFCVVVPLTGWLALHHGRIHRVKASGACQYVLVSEERLAAGYVGGAVRVGDTVRCSAVPWTPAVHALLAHLGKGFTGAPRPLGFDEQGREVLTFLEGETVGNREPRPAWVHAEYTLNQVARWMRGYHQAVADLGPSPDAVWRGAAPGHRA